MSVTQRWLPSHSSVKWVLDRVREISGHENTATFSPGSTWGLRPTRRASLTSTCSPESNMAQARSSATADHERVRSSETEEKSKGWSAGDIGSRPLLRSKVPSRAMNKSRNKCLPAGAPVSRLTVRKLKILCATDVPVLLTE